MKNEQKTAQTMRTGYGDSYLPAGNDPGSAMSRSSNMRKGKMKMNKTRLSKRRIILYGLNITLLVLCALMEISPVTAQTTPQHGVSGNGSYTVSDIEGINNDNGNMSLKFPLGALPAGRGGLSYGVTLSYDSKIYSSYPSTKTLCLPLGDPFCQDTVIDTNLAVQEFNSGGWQFNLGYDLRIIDRASYSTSGGLSSECPGPDWDKTFNFKVEMRFPDGSLHELEPALPYQRFNTAGYSDVNPTGGQRYCQQNGPGSNQWIMSERTYTTSGMTYYSSDGTYARLQVQSNGNWTLYLNDGTTVANAGGQPQKIYDRNNNYIEVTPTSITDQLNRSVTIQDQPNGETHIVAKGFNNQDLTWRILWKTIASNKTYVSSDGLSETTRDILNSPVKVVDQLIMPEQAGSLTYTFGYNANAYAVGSTTVSNGWGELSSITFPSGAEAKYEYELDGQNGLTDPDLLTQKVLDNRVTRKEVDWSTEYDGVTSPEADVWLYSKNQLGNEITITSPDGSVTKDDIDLLKKHSNKTINPDGSFSEKMWAENLIPDGAPGSTIIYGVPSGKNDFVKTEFSTIVDSSGQPAQTAIKDFNYDKNGNLTKVAEYDFVPYSSVPRNSNGLPTGLPSGATPQRITENTYYNATPDASDATTNSANAYWNTSSPNIRNAVASTEIKDGSNNVVSRTEFTYDNASTTGNLTGVKTWDSSKGAYSNPLTSGNSISVASQYDSYGNPTQSTDAKGIVSTITYGNIMTPSGTVSSLYPTQGVAAYGTAQARTTQTEYDFTSGAVTKVTDADNSVSTETEYDDLARPTKVKTAAGTASEIWTQTIYDPVNRRVITKSDLETKGDAKKVAIQHFDQLGKVRLSRTLEDASTQSATNEADGIKVQTRYKYDNPTTPTSSNGTYSLTSNPYRSSTSAGATSEEEMGWTLGYTDKTGKTSTVKTYGGAALPAPFASSGANTDLTGTSTTVIDENTSTSTDPAGKVGRSISNALGQLVRVDEPDSSGNLGTLSSPNQATTYIYDTLGKVVKVTQGVQSRYFKYDTLGRLLRVRQPEEGTNSSLSLADAITGNSDWSAGSTYDADGNMLTATDTKGTVITNTYDNLNRVLTRTYSDGTPTVTNTYDDSSIAYSKGKLTKTSNSISTSQILSLDNLGRVLSSRQTTDGLNYDSSYTYNLSGALVEETYPSGRKVKNSFQNDGKLGKIETQITGGSYQTRADNFGYAAHGPISQLQFGSGKWENAQFNSRLQVTQLGLGNSATDQSLWKLNYDFGTTDNNGNIKGQTTTVPSIDPLVQTFTYDSLNRLKSAAETSNGSPTWKQTFTYDRYGNRNFDAANTTTLGSCSTAVCNPTIDINTNRFTTGQGYTYDLAGNIIQDPDGRQFTFNGDNKQTEVKDASNTTIGTYYYDGDGKRIKKVTATEITTFVYSGGKLVAEYLLTNVTPTAPTTQYFTTDMLESPRIITDGSGNIVSRRDFMPFGEELNNIGGRSANVGYKPDTIRQKFTGYQKDAETDLDFAEARYYNSKNGRFTAVDPLLASGKSANPQTFNRYVYSLNNPLVMNDPSGMQVTSDPNNDERSGFYDPPAHSTCFETFGASCGPVNTSTDPKLAGLRNSENISRSTPIIMGVGGGTYNFFAHSFNAVNYGFNLLDGNPFMGIPSNTFGYWPIYHPSSQAEVEWSTMTNNTLLAGSVLFPEVAAGGEFGSSVSSSSRAGLSNIVGTSELDTSAGGLRDINPTGSTLNCINCAVATDATLAGRPASALPGRIETLEQSNLEKVFGAPFTRMTRGGIFQALTDAGPGARGIVFGGYTRGSGHVFNAINYNGRPAFWDGQIGAPAHFGGYDGYYFMFTHQPNR